jgi:4-alpha-glucanotransferase
MKILQFAFDGNHDNPYLPHNHIRNSVVYSGTHDNNTTVGWFESLTQEDRFRVCEYLGISANDMPWALIRNVLMSVSKLAVIPMQDILALGADSRMNTPGVAEGNWRWRFKWEQLPDGLASRMRYLIELYGRAIT